MGHHPRTGVKGLIMSKFRTRLRDLGRAGGIGFGVMARQPESRHVLVLAEVEGAQAATDAAAAGVDAVVLRGSPSLLVGLDLGATLAGVWLADATGAEAEAAREAGADFFLFDDGRAHASSLVPEDIGRVLLLGPDQETERLRSVSALDLDAVVVTGEVGSITVRDQLVLRRVAGLVGAPLLVASSAAPDAAALEAWRDAGAPAVLVTGDAATLRGVVQAAGAVPARRRRNDGVSPIISTPPVHHSHDDEDDDL